MSRSVLCAAAIAAISGVLSVSAEAGQVTIKFDGTDGETTNLWYGESAGGSNTGTQPGQLLMAPPATNWYFAASLLRMKNIPADFAGATINSAVLTMNDNWGGTSIYQGVEVRRIDTAANWTVGDGAQGNRWPNLAGRYDNGAGSHLADWTGIAGAVDGRGIGNSQGTGFDWYGNPIVGNAANTYGSFAALDPFEVAAMKDLVATIRLVGADAAIPDTALLAGEVRGVATTDLTPLVQHWADGSWDINDGFAFWMGNATEAHDGADTHGWDTTGAGLVIDYTAVPEPTSLALLALGGLMLARRSRA